MSLAVTGASFDGETVGVRCEDGAIAAIGPEVARCARSRAPATISAMGIV